MTWSPAPDETWQAMSPSTKKRASDNPAALPERYVMEDQVGFLMRVAMQRHTAIFMSLMIHDLTQRQFGALAKLVEVGPCSQNELGRLIYLDAATIKGVVERLRVRNLITIQGSKKDKRRSVIAVTALGRSFVNEAVVVAHQITKQTLSTLRPAEQRQIVRLLKKMI